MLSGVLSRIGSLPSISLLFLAFSSTLFAQNNPARTEIVFPFFVRSVGDYYGTTFEIINANAARATVRFRVFDSSGKELVQEAGPAVGLVATVEPGGLTMLQLPPYRNVVGWIKVTSSAPVIVQETITHDTWVSGPLLLAPPVLIQTRIVKSPPFATRSEVIEVIISGGGSQSNTGIAVAFPTEKTARANGRLSLRNRAGTLLAQQEISIGSNQQIAQLVTELLQIPSSALLPGGLFEGTLELTFDQDVYVTAIQLTSFPNEKWGEPNAGTVAHRTEP